MIRKYVQQFDERRHQRMSEEQKINAIMYNSVDFTPNAHKSIQLHPQTKVKLTHKKKKGNANQNFVDYPQDMAP